MNPIQSLWVGPRLSAMEQLCIRSFLHHGHEFHLYTYDDVAETPDGTVIKDGNNIMPKSEIGKFTHIVNFADTFRYKLVLDKGGWYVDMDMICLRPFDFPPEYVFLSSRDEVGSAVMKAPANSPIMSWCYEQARLIGKPNMPWEALGRVLDTAVKRFSLQQFVQPDHAFSFIPWWCLPADAVKEPALEMPADAFAAHLCHETWGRSGYDPDGQYPKGCLYEQLKERYS
jgi:Glycosyltransferase sugar-binding region containing DXD motif